jgi:hypothetical protein
MQTIWGAVVSYGLVASFFVPLVFWRDIRRNPLLGLLAAIPPLVMFLLLIYVMDA